MWNCTSLHFSPHFQIPHTLNPLKTLAINLGSRSYSIPRSPISSDSNHNDVKGRQIGIRGCSASAKSGIQSAAPLRDLSGADVVRDFYGGINRRDLDSVELLIGEKCVYEDLVFSRPLVGRKAIFEFFKKFTEGTSEDLQFVIDYISEEDSSAVGVTWHLEWKGRPFPFSRGCSFYCLKVLDGRRQIVYGRDCVEPATKPGEIALVLISGVTWLLERCPWLADRL